MPILLLVCFHKALQAELLDLRLVTTTALENGSLDRQDRDFVLLLLRRFEFLKHVYEYHCSAEDEAASLNSIVTLVKSNFLTIQVLVKEMRMYLSTTDNVIRAQEVLTVLSSKPLDSAIIHSLIGFFTDRLAGWRALHGARVVCLALLRRKANAGMVSAGDAKVVAQTYVESLQVQALGHHDRKICFELLQCPLVHHPNEVASQFYTLTSLGLRSQRTWPGSSTFPTLAQQVESCCEFNVLPCGDRSSLYVKQLVLVDRLSSCKYSNTQRACVGS